MKRYPAGRMNEDPSVGLSGSLRAAGFKLGRLQTGTPARIHKDSINVANLEVQHGDGDPAPFSYLNKTVDNAVSLVSHWVMECSRWPFLQSTQLPCFITRTTEATHQIIREHLHLSCHIQETKKGTRLRPRAHLAVHSPSHVRRV